MKNKFFKIILIITIIFTYFIGSTSIYAKSRKARGKNIQNHNKHLLIKEKPKKIVAQNQEIKNQENLEKKDKETSKTPSTKENIQKNEVPKDNSKEEKLENKDEEIYLNFENAELINFINYVADIHKVNIIPDKALSGNKISLTMRNPISKAQAWRILLSITEMAGYSIIKVGDIYKVIPKDRKLIQPLPVYIGTPPEELPESDLNIRYVYFLSNVKVNDILPWVNNMLGSPHAAIPNENNNGLILVDKSFNIKSVMKIVKELDKTGLKEAVSVLQLRYSNATEVRDLLNSLIEGEKEPPQIARLRYLLGRKAQETSSYFAKGTTIIAEERTNSLVLLGNKDTIEKIEKFVTKHIDTKLQGLESPLHIYELQYISAKQMVELLNTLLAPPESVAGQQAVKHGAVRGGVKYFKKMTFKADEEGNRLIVACTDKQDWKLLKKTIQNLDKPQPQVAVETLIVLVDAENNKFIGGQTRNKKHGQLGHWIDAQTASIDQTVFEQEGDTNVSLLGNLISGLTGQLGSTILSFGKTANLWGVFKMLQSNTNASIVAQPFLSVTNKYEASITIGETRRKDSQTGFDAQGNQITGKVDTQADLIINVKPQINIDGVVKLNIKITYNNFVGTSVDNKVERELDTNVSVANGQVLALGGFVKNKTTEKVYKTPVLGNIPVLGWLFKNKTKTVTKQNVLIFMCPTIIKPREYSMNLYTKMKLREAKDMAEDAILTTKSHDPIQNWFFDVKENLYARNIDDYASARYQPAGADIENDPYYRSQTGREMEREEEIEEKAKEKARQKTIAKTQTEEKKQTIEPKDKGSK